MSHGLIRLGMIAMLMVGVAAVVHAQAPGPPPPSHGGFRGPGGPGDGMFAFEGLVGNFRGKTVTGSPFSALMTSEHIQKLADGNSIDNKTTGNIVRDGSGRTRRDITLPSIGPWAASGQAQHIVSITDPVGQIDYILNMTKKSYKQFSGRLPGDFPRRDGNPPPPGEPGQPTTESLGAKTIEGVTAEGTRVTRTIPAGAAGNVNPIVITTERWFSPDLQLAVLETHTDPRFGTSIFQLTNISRNEPDPTMFTVPLDFTLQKNKDFNHGPRGSGKQPPPPPQD